MSAGQHLSSWKSVCDPLTPPQKNEGLVTVSNVIFRMKVSLKGEGISMEFIHVHVFFMSFYFVVFVYFLSFPGCFFSITACRAELY